MKRPRRGVFWGHLPVLGYIGIGPVAGGLLGVELNGVGFLVMVFS